MSVIEVGQTERALRRAREARTCRLVARLLYYFLIERFRKPIKFVERAREVLSKSVALE
jgi:hypothetical protein